MVKRDMRDTIYYCIANILDRENKEYAKLSEIYEEVATYLEVENNYSLQSQIRGRLQNFCDQYDNFKGLNLFHTEKVRSGNWTIVRAKPIFDNKFVRYLHNTYLVTNDNWTSQRKVKQITEEYILEENNDTAYKAKLVEEEGKLKANIIIDELIKIRRLLKKLKNIDKTDDGFGSAFEVFTISSIYNISYEEVINKYIVNGDLDAKIDAIYYGDSEEAHIYQIKLGDISDTAYNDMAENYNLCTSGEVPKDGKDLYNFINNNISILNDRTLLFKSVSKNSHKVGNYTPKEVYNMFFDNKLLPRDDNKLVVSLKKPSFSNRDSYQYNVSTDFNNNFFFYIKAKDLINSLIKSLGITLENVDQGGVDMSKYF